MVQRTYIVCDECQESKISKESLGQYNKEFDYNKVMEKGKQFIDRKGWVIKAKQDEEDPIAVIHEHYCRSCAADDAIFPAR